MNWKMNMSKKANIIVVVCIFICIVLIVVSAVLFNREDVAHVNAKEVEEANCGNYRLRLGDGYTCIVDLPVVVSHVNRDSGGTSYLCTDESEKYRIIFHDGYVDMYKYDEKSMRYILYGAYTNGYITKVN